MITSESGNQIMPPENTRGMEWPEEGELSASSGKTYLFAIGIDEYQHLTHLNNARRDAESVVGFLTEHFDCEVASFAPPLYDQEATRSQINQRFLSLARKFREEAYRDNLIIYFAGHGEWNQEFEAGYWALHGAKGQDLSTYYSNADLVIAIKAIKSHHTLIISDSCFSGGLIDTHQRRSNRKESKRSRYVLASGLKDETVSDGSKGTHSPFAQTILNFLEEKRGKEFRVTELESYIEDLFSQKQLRQEPIFAPLSIPDNEYGQLWLRPRFDVVQELGRLIKKGAPENLQAFILAKEEALNKRKKLKYAREQLESLVWQLAVDADQGEAYLHYLEQFLRSKNEHPEEALNRLGK
ncbi:MAG: caspase family protein [Bacteroidota bacterium]